MSLCAMMLIVWSLPGPLAPPGRRRPSLNMTALSYSCTTCNQIRSDYSDNHTQVLPRRIMINRIISYDHD